MRDFLIVSLAIVSFVVVSFLVINKNFSVSENEEAYTLHSKYSQIQKKKTKKIVTTKKYSCENGEEMTLEFAGEKVWLTLSYPNDDLYGMAILKKQSFINGTEIYIGPDKKNKLTLTSQNAVFVINKDMFSKKCKQL